MNPYFKNAFLPFVLLAILLAPACGRKGNLIIPGTVLPEEVGDLTASPGSGGMILTWTMPSRNTAGEPLGDLAGFDILRAEVPEGQAGCPCRFEGVGYVDIEFPKGAVVNGSRVAWTNRADNMLYGAKYAYRVAGVNKGGYTGNASKPVVARLLAPPLPPAEFSAMPGNRVVMLDWRTALKDEAGKPVDDLAGFNIYRSQSPDAPPQPPVNASPITEGTYMDSGLKNGQAYYYRVAALRGAEKPSTEGMPTSWIKATPTDLAPPAPVAGLQAVPGDGMVLLSWEPNTEEDLAGYRVYRQGPDDPGPRPLNNRPTRLITFKDTDVTPGATYTYAVTAVDNAVPPNEGGYSDKVSISVP